MRISGIRLCKSIARVCGLKVIAIDEQALLTMTANRLCEPGYKLGGWDKFEEREGAHGAPSLQHSPSSLFPFI